MIKNLDIYGSRFINKLTIKNKYLTIFFKLITHTSSGKIYPFYALLIPLISDKGILIAKTGILAFAFQVPIYIYSKNIIKRNRPSAIDGIEPVINPPDKYSFPSGHCASSMLFTLIVNQHIPSITEYFAIWMILVFISRIGLGLHYLTDAISGLFLGILSFFIATKIDNLFF